MSTLDIVLAAALALLVWPLGHFARRVPARSKALLFSGLSLFFVVNGVLSQHTVSFVFALIAAGVAIKSLKTPAAAQ